MTPFTSTRNLALVGSALTLCLLGGDAWGQPARREQPLKTPATKAGDGDTPTPKAGGSPTDKIAKEPDIAFKPLPPGKTVNFNLRDADLPDLVDAVSAITGRRFIWGSKVKSIKATIVSPQNVTAGEAYAAFLAVLEQNNMTVVPHGRYLKVIDSKTAPQHTTPILGTAEPVPYTDSYITRLYRLKHVGAGDVEGILGKFKSADADITVYSPSNLLIITDTGANIQRMLRIVEELDSGGSGEQIYLQPIHYMGASDLAASLNEMLDPQGGKIIADERNNNLVVVANEDDYKRILDLIKRIDVPATGGSGQIHVLPLQHAQCDELQQTLSQILSGTSAAPTGGGAARGNARAAPAAAASGGAQTGIFEGDIRVNCDLATNALITVSSLRDYAQLRNVIDKLDQPRRQVFIEAVIMDVNVDHASDLGLAFHGGASEDLGGGGNTIFYGGSNPGQSISGLPARLEALAFGVRGPDLAGSSQLLGTGVSIPAFGVVLHALAESGDSNVLATPHILATDGQTAEISIGQNIPLQTNIGGGLGNLANLAGGAGGQAGGLGALGALGGLGGLGLGGFNAPRQDVGIRLTIEPRINDSNQVRMDIQEEFSDAGSPTGALGAVPINKRTANTTIIVADQQTVVIGGLVREQQSTGETKIPVLGDIPVLGALFRRTQKQTQKTNLLLILTPHIIRDQNDLRRIFERKMQERQEFLDRYFVFEDSLPWEPAQDYSRTNGLVEHIRQSQLKLEERERLAEELRPDGPKGHPAVSPVKLPSNAGVKAGAKPAPAPAARPRPRPRPRPTPRRGGATRGNPRLRVPGSVLNRPARYRVE